MNQSEDSQKLPPKTVQAFVVPGRRHHSKPGEPLAGRASNYHVGADGNVSQFLHRTTVNPVAEASLIRGSGRTVDVDRKHRDKASLPEPLGKTSGSASYPPLGELLGQNQAL